MFAVRAFKTAIFGTPHPRQENINHSVQPSKDSESAVKKPEDVHAPQNSEECSDSPANTSSKPAALARLDPLASPTKGILLTPGTGTTRRKTVSFGHIQAQEQEKAKQVPQRTAEAEIDLALKSPETVQYAAPESKPRQSTLTRTLVQLAKQKAEKGQVLAGTSTENKCGPKPDMDFYTDSVLGSNADVTTDLSQPRSRSGQHWKTEYDQYHRRSNREMKKIIKYGQNVKSYAVKKDSEANNLEEKLKEELARVAAMEVKVSKLATELSNTQLHGPNGESDQSRLVSELAQQTALAIKYKQKADNLRAGIQRQHRPENPEEAAEVIDGALEPNAPSKDPSTRAELESLRATATAAEHQAAKLEKENAALKRSLARVKEEMMSYETRRQAREERLKKREAKHIAAKEECEKRLAQFTIDHENLLCMSSELPMVDVAAKTKAIQKDVATHDHGNPTAPEATQNPPQKKENIQPPQNHGQGHVPYISSRKKRLQRPSVDIWAPNSPQADENKDPFSKEPTQLLPSSVKHDIHRTLKEIDQNLTSKPEPAIIPDLKYSQPEKPAHLPTQPPPQPNNSQPSATHRMLNRRTTINSPRPSMINLSSSPAKLAEPSQAAKSENHISKQALHVPGRSTSLMSRGSGRTNTMGSGRVSSLSEERADAAKARLARRLIEKRTRQGV